MQNFQVRRDGFRALFPYVVTKAGKDTTHLAVEVSYELGGMNFFNGQTNRRGIYVRLRPITLQGGMEIFMLGEGIKILCVETKRKSDQKTLQVAQVLDALAPELAQAYISGNKNQVLERVLAAFALPAPEKAQSYLDSLANGG